MAQIQRGGIEIETVKHIETFGEWIRFTDDDGASFLIDPDVIETLYGFVLITKKEPEEGQ